MIFVKNYTVEEFQKIVKTQKVICIGAGQRLYELCDVYGDLAKQTICVIDTYKAGTTISVGGEKVVVKCAEEVTGELEDCILVLTCLKYAVEIIKQLEEIKGYKDKVVYIPKLYEEELTTVVELYRMTDSRIKIRDNMPQIIPKKIHYCWFGHSEIPDEFKRNIETWHKFCPDFEIIRWNESNYDITKNKYMQQAYESRKWGFVPDYARLDIINEHGGIYLDTDIRVLKSLVPLLQYNLFCGFQSERHVNFGLGFGARKNHPILQEMMSEYNKLSFIKEDGSLNLTTSPEYQTEVLLKYNLVPNGCCQTHKDYIAFSQIYFSPLNSLAIGEPTEESFSIHDYAGTWVDEEQKRKEEKKKEDYQFLLRRMITG